MEAMRSRIVFVFFATAILFSMVREWNAPITCARSILLSARASYVKRISHCGLTSPKGSPEREFR